MDRRMVYKLPTDIAVEINAVAFRDLTRRIPGWNRFR